MSDARPRHAPSFPTPLCCDPARATATELAVLQMQMEYDFDGATTIVKRAGSSQQARLAIYLVDGQCLRFNSRELEPARLARVERTNVEKLLRDHTATYELIGSPNGVRVWHGFSYTFSTVPVAPDIPITRLSDGAFAVLVDGRPVSRAHSARESPCAAELIVETIGLERRKGYARAVTRAWARHQLSNGRIPFYSHRHDNSASAGLAANLQLRQFCEICAYD
jgi:hypothetical protein